MKKKISKVKKKETKIKIKVKTSQNLEEEVKEDEDESFSDFISSGKIAVPTLATGQEVIGRASEQTPIRRTGTAEEESRQIVYGGRKTEEDPKKYETVMLKGSSDLGENSNSLSGQSGFQEMSARNRLSQGHSVIQELRERDELRERQYETKEESNLRVKRSRGWAA